jgi:hypothetical protein
VSERPEPAGERQLHGGAPAQATVHVRAVGSIHGSELLAWVQALEHQGDRQVRERVPRRDP